jgi:hypothetical protein
MLIVRYPSGVSIRYNTANQLIYHEQYWTLLTGPKDQGGTWVASIQVSAGVIVESVPACNIENPTLALSSRKVDQLMEDNWRELGKLKRQIAKLVQGG